MVLGKVPMNQFYGMRTKRTLKDEKAWFHLNEVGGMIFAMLGFPLVLGGVLGFYLPESALEYYGRVVGTVSLCSVGVAGFFL